MCLLYIQDIDIDQNITLKMKKWKLYMQIEKPMLEMSK